MRASTSARAVGSQVRAAADGKVEIAGPSPASATISASSTTASRRPIPISPKFPTAIKPGVEVKQGEIIALSGNTGLSTGPHLHFEFYLNGEAVDPLPHLGAEVQATAPTAQGVRRDRGGVQRGPRRRRERREIAAFPAAKAQVDAALEGGDEVGPIACGAPVFESRRLAEFALRPQRRNVWSAAS